MDRAEVVTVLSRLLFGDANNGGDVFWENHMDALVADGMVTVADPSIVEQRVNTFIMLMRKVANEPNKDK